MLANNSVSHPRKNLQEIMHMTVRKINQTFNNRNSWYIVLALMRLNGPVTESINKLAESKGASGDLLMLMISQHNSKRQDTKPHNMLYSSRSNDKKCVSYLFEQHFLCWLIVCAMANTISANMDLLSKQQMEWSGYWPEMKFVDIYSRERS